MAVRRYRRRPIEVEALYYDGTNIDEVKEFLEGSFYRVEEDGRVAIGTLEGELTANPPVYIVKGVKGECYPVKPEIFEILYEPIGEALRTQIGGSHYKNFKIQPIEFIHANGLGFIEGNIIKYVCRHPHKGGPEDLKKAKHYIDLLAWLAYKTTL